MLVMVTVGILALIVVWVLGYQPRIVVDLLTRSQDRILFRVPTDRDLVALTLDDGPSPELTGDLLDVLARHGARATFFVLGEKAARHPELIARIRAEGHEIGNHMMTNRRALLMGTEAFRREVVEADRVLGTTARQENLWAGTQGPAGSRFLRPGSGWIRLGQMRVVEELGYRYCLGSVYPSDGPIGHVGWTRWFVLRKVRRGDILILHEGSARRRVVLTVLEKVLPELRRRGLRVVSVGELA
jgi:peptidoglycan/xylan/chitin deacetylase (PgdA/CDA1 family)